MTTLMVSNERVAGKYVSDDLDSYTISCKKNVVEAVGNAAKLGFAAADAADPSIPNGLKPRRVKCIGTGGVAKWVICYTTAATLWTTPGTTIDLNWLGQDMTFTSTRKRRGETSERLITKSA